MKPVVVILNADINFELLGTSMDPAVLATAARAMLRDATPTESNDLAALRQIAAVHGSR
jgi:hypothetical protein